ncbi:MAG: efflux RND transporter periplasmic adaptor subunit [Bacteroidales bacterium]|nr:efflux RND transporter periplasmic adaptor subunit [Bacteroidales bacterium]
MKHTIHFLALFILAYFISCGSVDERKNELPESEKDQSIFRITRAQQEALSIDWYNLELKEIQDFVQTTGYLEVPPQNRARLSPMVAGRIERINFIEGDYIRKGQVIIQIESLEFIEMQSLYIELQNMQEYLELEFERQKELQEMNVNARKTFQQIEQELKTNKASLNAVSEKLKLMDLNLSSIRPDNITGTYNLYSPIDGYVSDIMFVLGSYVEKDEDLLEVINTEHFYAEVNIYEKDAFKIIKGQKMEITLPQIEGKFCEGEIHLVGKKLDAESRTIQAYAHINNKEGLIAGLFVNARIFTDTRMAFYIPMEGIIREEKGTSVFVVEIFNDSEIILRKVMVRTGLEEAGMVEIQPYEKLETGQKIAVGGIGYLSSNLGE